MTTQQNDLILRAEDTASRWGVKCDELLKLSTKRIVYKVSSRNGSAVLKINRHFGAEGGAVPFMQHAPVGVATKLLRVSPLRRAILMEWLEGPSLQSIYDDGDSAQAELSLAEAAAKLGASKFRYAFAFASATKAMTRRFKRCADMAATGPHANQFLRATSLFEQLVKTTSQDTIIHGDLHFENVISTPQGPRLIDAKGFRGDPAMDCANALTGPDPSPSVDHFCDRIAQRAAVFGPIIKAEPLHIMRWGAVSWASKMFYRGLRHPTPASEGAYLAGFLDLAQA